jgi:hypothetical protein
MLTTQLYVFLFKHGATAVSVKFFIMQPDTVAWFMSDNRAGLEFSTVAGDDLTPEWQVQGRKAGWLSNRARLQFSEGSE